MVFFSTASIVETQHIGIGGKAGLARNCFATVHRISLSTAAIALVVLSGWMLNVTLLKSGLPGITATQPMSAVLLLLAALALGASVSQRRFASALMYASAATLLAVTFFILIQNALDVDWGSDRLLFAHAVTHEQTGSFLRAGRPAGASLIGFLLIGIAVLVANRRSRWSERAYATIVIAGTIGATSLLLAYVLGMESLYVMGLYVQVGFYSAAALTLLFVGLLVRRADLAPVRYLCGDSLGAVSTRRLLSWTIAVLIVIGGIVQFGTRASWYRAELEIALVTLAGIGVLFAGLLSHSRRIDALDRSRRGIAERLEDSEARQLAVAQALADSKIRKEELLNALAHELRNPLAPLRNGLHILRRRTDDDQRLKPTVEMMERQLKELTQAIDMLIDEYGRDKKK